MLIHQIVRSRRLWCMKRYTSFLALLLIGFSAPWGAQGSTCSGTFAKTGPNQPEELGAVTWLRDYDKALAQSEKSGKPVLILFQEVPGCSNCTTYGNSILSEPLMVEAIEDLFVPMAVFNNKGGKDAAVLKRYGEPSWNNPVVRIVDASGKDIIDRMPNFRSAAQLSSGMLSALRRSELKVPRYLQLVNEQHQALEQKTAVATFQTACFWSGEAYFGKQEGVIATEAGWQDGREVVRVKYSSEATSEEVLAKAGSRKSYRKTENGKFRLDREPKYYLLKSKFSKVEMPEIQASRVNALLGEGRDPSALLSPRQLAML